MLKILRQEAEQGFWQEMSVQEADAEMGGFCSWLLFPVDEKNKVRGCPDPAELNDWSFLQETCWMPGIDAVLQRGKTQL